MRRGTCIVGIAGNGHVTIGGDSVGANQRNRLQRLDPKVFFLGDELLVGICGSFRIRDVLQYDVIVPERPEGIDDAQYLVSHLIPEIRNRLRDGGALGKEDHADSMEAAFLLGYRGILYEVDDDFQVGQPSGNYAATGSGYEYALGSLHSTRSVRGVEKRIRAALDAASEYCPSVGPPYVIERLG